MYDWNYETDVCLGNINVNESYFKTLNKKYDQYSNHILVQRVTTHAVYTIRAQIFNCE